MNQKSKFLLLGWVTLLVFPAVGLLLLFLFGSRPLLEVFEWQRIFSFPTLFGLAIGGVYAWLVVSLMDLKVFKPALKGQREIIQGLNLSLVQMVFISFCAGFGEEILFRAALQTWWGPWITTVVFIAAHGYLDPRSWEKMLPGILLFPFILFLAFGYEIYGLWFCVAGHFIYDLIMFLSVKKSEKYFP